MSEKITSKLLLAATVPAQSCAWRWRAMPEWYKLVDCDHGIRWLELSKFTDAKLLKESELRSVWRLRIDEQVVIAKVYQPPRGWDRIKAMVLGSPARREFLAGLCGRHFNLSTARPIACGQLQAGSAYGAQVLLTEEIAPAQSLSAYWLGQAGPNGHRTRSSDNQLISRAAQFLERLHSRSFVPSDLHPENILVTHDGDFVLVDLYKATFNTRVSELARILNLADLNQWFQRHANRSDRLRFLLAYLTYAFEKPSPKLIHKYVREIVEATAWKSERLEKKRDKRVFSDNKYFGVITLPDHWTAHVFLQAKRPISGSRCSQLHFLKSEWRSTLQQIIIAEKDTILDTLRVGANDVPVTVENSRSTGNRLRDLWRLSYMKINRHQVVPLPLALLERRTSDKETESILIAERSTQP